jgi:hypothetical protein
VCGGCGRGIQWHRSLHSRIRVGKLVYVAGAVILLLCGLGAVVAPGADVPYRLVAGVTVFLPAAGILVTRTRASEQFVELVDDDR